MFRLYTSHRLKNLNSSIDFFYFSIIKFYYLEFKPLIKFHLCIKFCDDDDDDEDDDEDEDEDNDDDE